MFRHVLLTVKCTKIFFMLKRRVSSPLKPSSSPKKIHSSQAQQDTALLTEFVSFQSPQEVLESLTTDPSIYKGNVCNMPRKIESRPQSVRNFSFDAREMVDNDLLMAYTYSILSDVDDSEAEFKLYSHQADAIKAILLDNALNVCISTSTSSGKSLAFNMCVLSRLISEPGSTALYLYPTKALTQDQKRVIDSVLAKRTELRGVMGETPPVTAGILDGDVLEMAERIRISQECSLILSNPDMLHFSILPNHRKFSKFLSGIRFVVIDEAHCYNGVFGSHVSSVIRRLRRVLAHYSPNVKVQYISCSATIGNPEEHVGRLIGIPCDKLVSEDGSPSGERILALWNSRQGESISDVVSILSKLVTRGVRFICFCKNRFLIELILKSVAERLKKNTNHESLASKIVAYRAGYSAEERRRLEQEIFSGQVLGVVATSALELGMDIGCLDVGITFGYPGSIHSLWQQWGRAGRGMHPCLCMLICREEDVVDSWICQDDSRLLEQPPEDAVLQVANPYIVKNHLICADIELRFMKDKDWEDARTTYWPDVPQAVFAAAKKEAPFVKKKSFSIRNIESRKIFLNCDNVKIDELDISQAFFYLYPGAVHSVQGVEYRVVELSLKTNTATAVKATHDYFTRPSDITEVIPAKPPAATLNDFVFRGRADVSTKVKGFYRVSKTPPHELVQGGYEALELPTIKFVTNAVWVDVKGFDPLLSASGLHGAAHAIFFASCQRLLLSSTSDIKCGCHNESILLYDSQNGGLGISEMIYERLESLVHIALGRVTRCSCPKGCIKCLLISSCSDGNKNLNKDSTIELLTLIQQKLDSLQSSQ